MYWLSHFRCVGARRYLTHLSESPLKTFGRRTKRLFGDESQTFSSWAPRGVYSTGIWVGGFGRLNETLTLFKTEKMWILLPCLRESAVISYPVQDWTKQAVFKTLKTVHQFAFSRIPTKAHEIGEHYSDRRGKKGEDGDDPVLRHENVKLCTLFKRENPENDTLTVGTSLYRKYIGVPSPPGLGTKCISTTLDFAAPWKSSCVKRLFKVMLAFLVSN